MNISKLGRRAPARRDRVRAMLAAGTALGVGLVVTFASFSDQAKVTTSFATGKVDIKVDTQDGVDAPVTFGDWADKKIKPGDTVYAQLTVKNAGTLDVNYSMGTPAFGGGETPALATAMKAGIRLADTCNEGGYDKATDTKVLAEDDTLDKLQVPQRPLAQGAEEKLCLMATLPLDASATNLQGATINPLFTIAAAQTTN